jgi:hypothetical protein
MSKGTKSNGCATAANSSPQFKEATLWERENQAVKFSFVLKVEQVSSPPAQLWDGSDCTLRYAQF